MNYVVLEFLLTTTAISELTTNAMYVSHENLHQKYSRANKC